MLRDARTVPNVSQTAAELSTVISLVDAHMGVAILPASAVKHSIASVVACDIVGDLPMSEIALVCDIGVRAPIADKFRFFALKSMGHSRTALYANRS
jgi:DNA-binding transcriptional LysR family regulator